MEICHFFVIFYDFVMKCVYKSTIYTFVIRDKIWTPPLCCTKVYMLLLCFGSRKHPPTPYMSGTFVLAPPECLGRNMPVRVHWPVILQGSARSYCERGWSTLPGDARELLHP